MQEAKAGKESGTSDSTLPGTGRGNTQFASETSTATGQTRQHVNRATRRAREVCQQARDLIRGTKLDTGAFLDGLIKQGLPDAEQVALVTEKLEALADEQRRRELAEEEQARKEAAKQQRDEARRELVNFLFEKLTAQEWQSVVELLEASGGALPVLMPLPPARCSLPRQRDKLGSAALGGATRSRARRLGT